MARLRHLLVAPPLLAALLLPQGECASRPSVSSSRLRGNLRLEQPKQRVAMCVAGNLRTFNVTAPTIRPFLRNLSAVGLTSDEPDIFLYGTLAGANAKHQVHYNFARQDVTREDATRLASRLEPTSYSLPEVAEEVTGENLDQYVANRFCFSAGFWHTETNLIRSMNQLVHLQSCVDMILEHEEWQGQRYDAVILSRPDMLYEAEGELAASLLERASQGIFVFQWDWFMLMPRSMVTRIVDPGTARPLNCSTGQPCCGKVKSSEDMFEYFFGASTRRDSGSCNCSAARTKAFRATVGKLKRTAWLGRRARRPEADELSDQA